MLERHQILFFSAAKLIENLLNTKQKPPKYRENMKKSQKHSLNKKNISIFVPIN